MQVGFTIAERRNTNKNCQTYKSLTVYGATGRTRTGDLLITNQLLYQLSHSSKESRCTIQRVLFYYTKMRLSTFIFFLNEFPEIIQSLLFDPGNLYLRNSEDL